RVGEFDEFVGYHLERAAQLRTELGQRDETTRAIAHRAFEHLTAAGRRALHRGDMATAANLLVRASGLVEAEDPDRLRMAWALGHALNETGAMTASAALLDETIALARAAGDEAAAGYAECVRWTSRVVTDPEMDVDDWESSADRLIALFEEAGDHLGAALAWAQKAYVYWLREHLQASGEAAGRAIAHAEAAGEVFLVSEMREHHLATVGLGPTPLAEVGPFVQQRLEEARSRGDRRLERGALVALAIQAALQRRFDEGRVLMAEAREISKQLGRTIEYWASAQPISRIEWFAGDLDAAAASLHESCEELEALGETAFLSTSAAMLAEVELERGDRASAERWLDVARRTTSRGDRSSVTVIEVVEGWLLALDGDPAAGGHLRRALELVDDTDSPLWRTDVRLQVAQALTEQRPDEAGRLAREAIELSSAKGLEVLVDRGRAILDRLGERSTP
ncbi:MAG TPA: hypothetical protein VFQ40_01940, partial [Actinomycetota bacterium]|nr:hypothetical protein [Actinomycetota bacterium]